jgi:hypothetical protein
MQVGGYAVAPAVSACCSGQQAGGVNSLGNIKVPLLSLLVSGVQAQRGAVGQ